MMTRIPLLASAISAGALLAAAAAAALASTSTPASVAKAPLSPPFLQAAAFLSPSAAYGTFVRRTANGKVCQLEVATTSDGGRQFAARGVATAWLCDLSPAVTSIAADKSGDVFLSGPQLLVSHDHGRSWQIIRPGGAVLAVSVVGRSVWLVTARCTGHGSKPDLCPIKIIVSGNGGQTWHSAPSQPGSGAVPGFGSQVTGSAELVRTGPKSGYLLGAPAVSNRNQASSPLLWATSNGGKSWVLHPVKCGMDAMSAAISVAPAGQIFVVCAGEPGTGFQAKSVSTSVDGGRTWTLRYSCTHGACPPLGEGYLGQIAAASSGTLFLVGDRSSLLVSRDSGRSWHRVKPSVGDSGGGTFQVTFFGSDGIVVGLDGAHNELPAIWHTGDGGTRWHATMPAIG
jgi:hypothetical protein